MRRAAAFALALGLAAASPGCSSRPVIPQHHLTVSTRSNAAPAHEVLGPVSVSYCDHVAILILPFVQDQRDVYGLLLEQVRQQGGHAMTDFRLQLREIAYFFPLYMKGCWHAEGTAIRFVTAEPAS